MKVDIGTIKSSSEITTKKLKSKFISESLLKLMYSAFLILSKKRNASRTTFQHKNTRDIRVGMPSYRYTDHYEKVQMAKYWFLHDWTPVAFLTLTFSPRKLWGISATNPVKDIGELKKIYKTSSTSWNNLLRHIQKKHDDSLSFWAVWESTKNGFPHLHIAFYNEMPDNVWQSIGKWWNERYGFMYLYTLNSVGKDQEGKEWVHQWKWRWNRKLKKLYKANECRYPLGNYIARYISKYLTKDAPLIQRMIFTVLGKRSFSTSEDIKEIRRIRDQEYAENISSEWEFLEQFRDPKNKLPPGTYQPDEYYSKWYDRLSENA